MTISIKNFPQILLLIAVFLISSSSYAFAQDANSEPMQRDEETAQLKVEAAEASAIQAQTNAQQAQQNGKEMVPDAMPRESSPEFQAYLARLKRTIHRQWKPKRTFLTTPIVFFNVSKDGTITNPKILSPSPSEDINKGLLNTLNSIGKVEVPPDPSDFYPVVTDFTFDPWYPGSTVPYPEISEEWLGSLGFAYEIAGLVFSFLLLITSFALVCIKKFSRAIQMAFVSIILAIAALAAPGLFYVTFEKMGVTEANGMQLVQLLSVLGSVLFLAFGLMPIIVAVTRGKKGKDLIWVSVLTALGAVVPITWAGGLFLACKGPRASRSVSQKKSDITTDVNSDRI
jgi:hypothetical protein